MATESDRLVFNGVHGDTGGYLLPPMSPEELTRIALGERLDPRQQRELAYRHQAGSRDTYRLGAGLDARDLGQTGWGVVFAHDADPAVRATRERLASLLANGEAPVLLFTASHGMGFEKGSARQIQHQGALLCQDWPGTLAVEGSHPRELRAARRGLGGPWHPAPLRPAGQRRRARHPEPGLGHRRAGLPSQQTPASSWLVADSRPQDKW